jgi:hypothetical protein
MTAAGPGWRLGYGFQQKRDRRDDQRDRQQQLWREPQQIREVSSSSSARTRSFAPGLVRNMTCALSSCMRLSLGIAPPPAEVRRGTMPIAPNTAFLPRPTERSLTEARRQARQTQRWL